LYSSPDIILVIKLNRMRLAGHVARIGERRSAHRVLMGKPEGKRPLAGSKRRWEDNIKVNLQEVGLGVCTGLICLRTMTGGGDELLGSIKMRVISLLAENRLASQEGHCSKDYVRM